MDKKPNFKITRQPDDITCGPTCLNSIYSYYDDKYDLHEVIKEIQSLDKGGTLAVVLGTHALKRGYKARIYTYNLQLFDPTWFSSKDIDIREKLAAQMKAKSNKLKIKFASKRSIEFLDNGGKYAYEELTSSLLRKYLKKGIPILCGLSATYLYQSAREDDNNQYDDINGLPAGHFVVLYGYDRETKDVYIADPLHPNQHSKNPNYKVNINRVLSSILLGILTHDANLLIIEKK